MKLKIRIDEDIFLVQDDSYILYTRTINELIFEEWFNKRLLILQRRKI